MKLISENGACIAVDSSTGKVDSMTKKYPSDKTEDKTTLDDIKDVNIIIAHGL